MVERLFRGKRVDNGEWVFGFYFCMYHDDDREHLHHFIIPLNVSIPKDRPIGEIQVEVDPTTVGQCVSNLPDKNGKKIFEGDIFIDPDYPDAIYQVDYEDGAFVAKERTTNEQFFLRDFVVFGEPEVEVIGNIHDNPELLGGKP